MALHEDGIPWRVGARVGELVIVRKLGQGGMGATFLVEHATTGERRALKVMLGRGEPGAVARFVREGEAQAAAAGHENVLRVLSAGVHAGSPYLVLDFASGGSLAEKLRAGPLPVAEACRIALALARGLAHVHARGVLHRDLKPENVMFDADGTPKLVDFGLARVAGATTLTRSGDMLGTPAYMAPEQTETSKTTVDARADVYGLGAVLYAALAGRAPFVGESSMNVVVQVLKTVPAPPSSHRKDVPAALDALCAKALAKRREDRPPSAEAFAAELEAALGALGARPPRARALGVVLAVVLLALGAGALAFARRPAAPAPPGTPVAVVGSLAITLTAVETTHREKVTVAIKLSAPAARLEVRAGDSRQEIADTRGALARAVEVPLRVGKNTIEVVAPGWSGSATVVVFRFTIPDGFVRGEDPGEVLYGEDSSIVLRYHPPGESYMGWNDASSDPIDVRERELMLSDHSYKPPEDPLVKTINERPRVPIRFEKGFFLGKYELTWRQYRRIEKDADRIDRWAKQSPFQLAAREPTTPAGVGAEIRKDPTHVPNPPAGWQFSEDMPVYNVALEDVAVFFSGSAGLRLPSEAEWVYAARGGDQRRLFPWGDAIPDERKAVANIRRQGQERPCVAIVGSYPLGVSRWGCLDLGGNVYEWTSDLKYKLDDRDRREAFDRYQYCGGAFDREVWRARNSFRATDNVREARTGFRVAADALE